MSVKRERGNGLPYLGDDVLFKIFVKCHAKTVGRLRTLSKFWSERLKGKLFVEQNWKENEDRDDNVLIGFGYTPYGDKSHWCVGVNANTGEEIDLQPPVTLVEYGYFIIIGSDRGNLCIRFSEKGEESGLMVWNPITKYITEIEDQACKYWGYSVSVYAFGYLDQSWEYRVVYLFKKLYQDRDAILAENVRSIHRICSFKKGLGFISYDDVGIDREVNVWSLFLNEEKKFSWEKIIYINSFGIPHSPNILKDHDFLSVLDTRSTSTGSNDEQRTEVVVSKRKHRGGNRSILYHQGWQMSIFV
ncbi:hypothetical protein PIB30_078098 [Stylosanthes scabra]|uniref:F-box associated domain-containing protein n=1 Tax=Stylosanthes scabra TaxID=79078 RepID=A0ABU6TR52_9FABA|nr:hypothetical protein [Stylosanthes scabra]